LQGLRVQSVDLRQTGIIQRQAKQMPQISGLGFRGGQPGLQGGSHFNRSCARCGAQQRAQQVLNQRIGLLLAVRQAAAQPPAEGLTRQGGAPFGNQAALAQAGLAQHQGCAAAPALHCRRKLQQRGQFGHPADHGAVHACQAAHRARAVFEPQQGIGLHRFGQPFDQHWRQRSKFKQGGGQAVGLRTQHNGAALRNIFEPGSQIDCTADDRIVLLALRADAAGDDQPGVDANVQAQGSVVHRVEGRHGGHHLQGGAQRAGGVVFVRHRCAKHSHHLVADEFIHHATVLFNDRHQHIKAGVEQAANLFGIQLLGERGKARQVGKQNRDLAALAADAPGAHPNGQRGGAQR